MSFVFVNYTAINSGEHNHLLNIRSVILNILTLYFSTAALLLTSPQQTESQQLYKLPGDDKGVPEDTAARRLHLHHGPVHQRDMDGDHGGLSHSPAEQQAQVSASLYGLFHTACIVTIFLAIIISTCTMTIYNNNCTWCVSMHGTACIIILLVIIITSTCTMILYYLYLVRLYARDTACIVTIIILLVTIIILGMCQACHN